MRERVFFAARRAVLPAIGLIAVALVAGIAGYATKGNGGSQAEDVRLEGRASAVRGVVQQATAGSLTISTRDGQTVTYSVSPDTTFETLGTTTALHLVAGKDWLNVGAIPHPQTLFVISGLVVVSESGPP